MSSIDGEHLTLDQIVAVARQGERVALSPKAKKKMAAARRFIDQKVARGETIYGVTTGVGSFADTVLERSQAEKFQENLILSTAAGVGAPLAEEEIRALMLLSLNCQAKGHSGSRVEVPLLLTGMLNRKVHPVIPSQGSVGASGDLAPLAHMALVLIGQGEAVYRGRTYPGAKALKRAGLKPIRLREKEGLALINGTHLMTGLGMLALTDAIALVKQADVVGALTCEAVLARSAPFDARVHRLRPHPGQTATAGNFRKLLKGSRLIDAELPAPAMVQDAYSIRCIPQVHGAVRDAMAYVRSVLEIEINSTTDNPLIFANDGAVLSAGNFHGQPVAQALDHLSLALTTLGNISERRIAKLLDKNHNNGLPAFLIPNGGLNSGLMVLQYTAAALASENKVLCYPASADTIPTSANQEDHVSMGPIAARHARQIAVNVANILAIELFCAYQALGLRLSGEAEPTLNAQALSPAAAQVRKLLRKETGLPEVFLKDENFGSYQGNLRALLVNERLAAQVERVCGKLV